MTKVLHAINLAISEVEDYIAPLPGQVERLDTNEQEEFFKQFSTASEQYKATLAELVRVLPSLSPAEIAESYPSSCRLLQRSLGGYMARHFDPLYVPVMVKAIESEQLHVASVFLQALMAASPLDAAPLVLSSLDSSFEFMQEIALQLVQKYHITTAAPRVRSIADANLGELSTLAREILMRWSL